MRLLIQLLIICSFAIPHSEATVFYVATSGNDSSQGSQDAPFRTLSRAVAAAGPGDTVIVGDGTYGHENSVTGGDSSLVDAIPVVLKQSGNPNAWITIQAEHKWLAVLDCEMLCDAYIDLKNSSYIVIQDFVITRGYKEAIHNNDAAHHITLRGNRIEFIANRPSSATYGLDGMYAGPNSHDFIIDGNMIHDIGRTNTNWLDHGLYLRGANFTITNNIFYNIPHGWSIQAAQGLSNVMIANNTFAFPNGAGKGGQIMLWNTNSNLTIRNNIFYQPQQSAIIGYQSSVSSCTIDHNLVFGVVQMVTNSSGCGIVSNVFGDPQVVNPSASTPDFHLLGTSPAGGAGWPVPNVIADFDGNARSPGSLPDLGAYVVVRNRQP